MKMRIHCSKSFCEFQLFSCLSVGFLMDGGSQNMISMELSVRKRPLSSALAFLMVFGIGSLLDIFLGILNIV